MKINFYQNDDWCYYLTVESFLKGIFILHPYIGPTFYMQGLMGMLFSNLFGISHLPVLTLFVACASLYVFTLIIKEFFRVSLISTTLIGLIYLLNPLGVYEFWSFMSNHYFGLFMLIAFYFFLKYEQTSNKINLIMYLVFNVLSLLVRQTALVLPLSGLIYYLLKKNIKMSLFNFGCFITLYILYSKVIPLTPRILESPLRPEFMLRNDYVFALIYGTLIMLVSFTLPLVLNTLNIPVLIRSKSKLFLSAGIALLVFVVLTNVHKPMSIANGEFPYFENIFERTGFYPAGIQGTKYHFSGNFVVWKYWDLISRVGVAALFTYLLFNIRRKPNIYLIFICVYLAVMLVTQKYYDRYIFTVVPIFIFYLLSIKNTFSKLMQLLMAAFCIFLGFLVYTYSADFVYVNQYVWNKSQEVVTTRSVSPEFIAGTNAWKLTYKNIKRNYVYYFSYDSPEVNSDYKENFNLVDTYVPKYPLNIFVNPKIYLYEKKLLNNIN